MKHILFITSTNLASNPRCLKEVRLAVANGFTVSVIAFEMDNWTKPKEQLIREGMPTVNFHYIPAGRKPFMPWLMAVMQEKYSQRLSRLGGKGFNITATAVNRRSALIMKLLRRKKIAADLVIAHNPGAFYPAAKYGVPYAVDVEDYHPGESHDPLMQDLQKRLLQLTLPGAQYVSFASSPIMKQVSSIVASKDNFVIDNIFPASDFPQPATSSGPLQLLWFSQNIDVSRGLEQLLPALDAFAADINLILIGNLKQDFYEQYLAHRKYVIIQHPVTSEELHQMAGRYDIGLAIEPGKDLNNKLALSNKMWVYFQAGLYILATDTEGQRSFMDRFPQHGTIISLEKKSLQSTIAELLNRAAQIRQEKQKRWEAARNYGWENESKQLLNKWTRILHS